MCLVLYGSATGNAADLAELLFDELRRRNLEAQCKPFGEATLAELGKHNHVFVVASTTGQGALPQNTQPLWTQLLRRGLRAPALANLQLYTFGLGSSAYPRFNWAVRKIHARLVQLGAREAVPRGEADEQGALAYEEAFEQWMRSALSTLDSALQITEVRPLNELLPPVNAVQLVSEMTPPPSPPAETRVCARVAANTRITSEEHFQDVRRLTLAFDEPPAAGDSASLGPAVSALSLSPGPAGRGGASALQPGDVVSLYPGNDDASVDAVLRSQQWSDERVTVKRLGELTLRALLKWHVDLNAIPRRQFFMLAAHFCTDERQAERMREFAADLDDLFNYTSRPRRSVAEVLDEFDSLRIPVEYVLDLLPPMRVRQFSIASPPLAGSNGSEVTVDLAVAIVKYRTVLRRIRRGTCTRWISQLRVGDEIRVSFEYNRMRLAERVASTPTILVATGTGIAPIRSLLLALPADAAKPHLFFGCRSEAADFLFGDELKSRANVVTAFSRDGGGYVQQQIRKHSELPVAAAFIFVCGSSGAMPQAVRQAFVDCLVDQGSTASDAERIIAEKEKQGSYMQETW